MVKSRPVSFFLVCPFDFSIIRQAIKDCHIAAERRAILDSASKTSEGKIDIGLVQRIITLRTKLGKPARRVPVLVYDLGFQFGLPVLTHRFLTPVLIWKLVVASTATFESQFSTPDF
ncbi:hypothetical protein Avbf_02387 [Armadillidium vulgare]|nr:hypothetical protein Avbf_02387 [Armadillidium vulgare]